MRRTKIGTLICGLLLLVLAALAAGCGDSGTPAESASAGRSAAPGQSCGRAEGGGDYTVGFIYNSPLGQGGYVSQHDLARKAVEALPGVKTAVIANVPDADAQPAIDQLLGKGAKVIFGITVGYADAFMRNAQQHPDVCFVHTRPGMLAANVATYSFADWDPAYVLGVTAARMSRTGKIGFVGALPIPPIVRDANAYLMGARSVNPRMTLDAVFVNSFFDPPKEQQAAKSLVDGGADVLVAGYLSDASVVQEAARHPGVHATGMFSDQQSFGPEAYLGSIVFNLAPHFTGVVRSAMEGDFRSEDFLGGIDNDALQVPLGDAVPADVQRFVEARMAALKSGELNPFTGPISDQKGKVRIEDGHEMTLDELVNWSWFVEGVKGTLSSGG